MRRRVLVPLVLAGLVCAGAGIVIAQPVPAVVSDDGPDVVYSGSYTPLATTRIDVIVDAPWRAPVGDGLLALGAGAVGAAIAAEVLARRHGRG